MCAYIYVYVHIYIHIHTYIHTYIHAYIHTYNRSYMHTYMHTYIHTYIHIYIYLCIYLYKYIYIYMHTTNMYIYTHTRIQYRCECMSTPKNQTSQETQHHSNNNNIEHSDPVAGTSTGVPREFNLALASSCLAWRALACEAVLGTQSFQLSLGIYRNIL